MIAKAATISHGANAIRYSIEKDKADIVKVNLLPDNISAEAMYARMILAQRYYGQNINHGKPLKRNVIRMEISPAPEESEGWTLDDWRNLSDEFIQVFDSVDLSQRTKRASTKSTNVKNSQYVVALHRDAVSGILHLHIDANRVDDTGKVNDDHMIYERAMKAAYIINERRGWIQAQDISTRNKEQISNCCMKVLRSMEKFSWPKYSEELRRLGLTVKLHCNNTGIVKGYSVTRGNSCYKSSELGKSRNLTPSKILNTWEKLHHMEVKSEQNNRQDNPPRIKVPQSEALRGTTAMMKYDISTDEYHTYHIELPIDIDRLIRQECQVDENSFASLEEVCKTALLLFAGYLDGATHMAVSSGGGGGPTDGWGRDPDEDAREWARRCAQMANHLCKRRKGMRR